MAVEASEVMLSLKVELDSFILRICDNGRGLLRRARCPRTPVRATAFRNLQCRLSLDRRAVVRNGRERGGRHNGITHHRKHPCLWAGCRPAGRIPMSGGSAGAASGDAGLIRVAVVEDDEHVRRILCGWIREAGMACVRGSSATLRPPFEALPTLHPQVALVDTTSPGANGILCVRRLKPLLQGTQFVMLTVYEDTDHIFDALAAGATGYLVKRTPREAVIAALREVNGGGSPMSTNIARKVVQFLQEPSSKAAPADGLSPREGEVLGLLARGYLYKEISESIGVSLPTVNTYIRRIYEKLHVRSRAQAVARFTHFPAYRASRK